MLFQVAVQGNEKTLRVAGDTRFSRRVDGREDDMVMRVGNILVLRGDEPMRREGLQARGIYKEVPRPSRELALAATKRSLI